MHTIKKDNNRIAAKNRTAERITYRSNEDRNAPITAVENQLITSVLYEISRSQSTSSPDEDSHYAVETSRLTSKVTTSWNDNTTLLLKQNLFHIQHL